ncbi:MAG: bifunctional riboflavin kinase/FAD synthetase [Deltaproteobacteria bacterium]|nr:bifunctional riboflavin kinase/FAD synthetase [Deltaproteobacteria bacterium]
MNDRLRVIGAAPSPGRACTVCVGNFDGLHLGHRSILARARELAGNHGEACVALTFEPHPLRVLRPEKVFAMIYPHAERYRQLAAAGMDAVAVEEFTRDTADTEPEAWIEGILLGALGAAHVVVGYDFRFGHMARGDAAMLQEYAATRGVQVEVMEPVASDGLKVSSSRIRRAIGAGDVETAARLLDRPFHVRGFVAVGAKRGRTLGFPTANLQTDWELIPANGVYAGIAVVDGTRVATGISVGTNPTFGDDGRRIEAHLIDWSGDIYGCEISVHFLARLRDEIRFPNVEALVAQMRADIDTARTIAARHDGGLDP